MLNEDALAAVVVTAQLLLARSRGAFVELGAPAGAHWTVAGRLRMTDVARVRLAARSATRWAASGRLRD